MQYYTLFAGGCKGARGIFLKLFTIFTQLFWQKCEAPPPGTITVPGGGAFFVTC